MIDPTSWLGCFTVRLRTNFIYMRKTFGSRMDKGFVGWTVGCFED